MSTLSAGSSIPSLCCVLLLSAGLVVWNSGCSVQPADGGASDESSAAQSGATNDPSPDQITPADIHLAGVRLGSSDGGNTFQVAGRIENDSPTYTLTELDLKVVMQDCLDSGVCEVLAEDVANVSTNIPAGEAQDFEVAANFGEMRHPKGTLGWHYAVVDAKGTRP